MSDREPDIWDHLVYRFTRVSAPNAETAAVVMDVLAELASAQSKFPPLRGAHEAQSVIGEEFHELTLAVWFGVDQRGRPADPRHEAVQVAAMAIRYLLDVR